jgi:hypothetical protein
MKIPVTMIERVADSAMTEDGHHMALTLRQPTGDFLTLGFPGDEVPRLIDRAARALSDRERILRPDGSVRFAATWWNLIRQGEEGDFVLSFTFGTGGALSFVLTGDMAARLKETLCCLVGSDASHGDVGIRSEKAWGVAYGAVEPHREI